MHKSKEEKRREAELRQEAYGQLSLKGRLNKLDNLFGKGRGAKKERARLQQKIEAANEKKKQHKEVDETT